MALGGPYDTLPPGGIEASCKEVVLIENSSGVLEADAVVFSRNLMRTLAVQDAREEYA